MTDIGLVTELSSIPRCRGCLGKEKTMKNIFKENLDQLLIEAANICVNKLEPCQWHWLCWECEALLKNCVKFQKKLAKTEIILQQYITHNFLVPEEVLEGALCKPAWPDLNYSQQTHISASESNKHQNDNENYNTKNSYKMICQNGKKKSKMKSETVSDMDVSIVKYELDSIESSLSPNIDSPAHIDEDDHPEQHFLEIKLEFDLDQEKMCQQTLDLEPEGERERRGVKKKKKKSKKERKEKKLKVSKIRKIEDVSDQTREKTRVWHKLDPQKIRTIKLTDQEQLQAKEEASTREEYLRSPFKCSLCVKGFNFQQKLNTHMMWHDKKRGQYECPICHVFIDRLYAYTSHRKHHEIKYQCVECGKTSPEKMQVVRHYRVVHEGGEPPRYTCHYCGKCFRSKPKYMEHEKNHREEVRYECDLCGKVYNKRDSMILHILVQHGGTKEFKCDLCSMRFVTHTNLAIHRLTHSTARDFYCSDCDASFKSQASLKYHLLTGVKHIDVQRLRFACDRCSKRFQTENMLRKHVDIMHLGVRPFACSSCPHTYQTSTGLKRHTLTQHHGILPPLNFTCETCGKSFREKSCLKNHIRVHTGERPYTCPYCGATFTQRTAMQTHVKLVHLKIKRNARVRATHAVEKQCQDTNVVLDSIL